VAELARRPRGLINAYWPVGTGEYAEALPQSGLDEATARYVPALDASIARGDLQTSSHDLV
jgi:hypothetical protein